MEKVTGIGGIFIKAQNPDAMAAWYRDHLGIATKDGYTDFQWREKENPEKIGQTLWSLFPADTEYFKPSAAPFMINFRVADLEKMIEQLRKNGIAVEAVQDFDYGRFAWVMDPEGNRIELWEPKGPAPS